MRPLFALAFIMCWLGAASASHPLTDPIRVAVVADGKLRQLPTSAATVRGLLAELQIALGPLDRTDPSPDTPVTEGIRVQITRVTCEDTTESIPLHASTVVLADPDKPLGSTTILAEGRDGMMTRSSRTWKKDGVITAHTVMSEEIITEPRDCVVLRGSRGLPTRSGYWRSWRSPLLMEATAYDPGPRSCGKWASGYTATGIKAQKGVVAVDDRIIPMGTRLYIPGYGFALAADRGSAIKGMRIDLCFPTYREAIRFGRRRVKVYRLD